MSDSLPARHPEWEAMLQKRDALHSQIVAVLSDIYSLKGSREVVLGHYANAFGNRLIRLQAAEIEAARLKREIELIQIAINSGEEIDYEKIQEILESEFAEWQARMEAEAEKLNRQKMALSDLLDSETCRALKEKFRILARRLHPDLNPDQSRADAELWHRVTAAYEAQDLEELEAIEILSRDADYLSPPESLDALQTLLGKLRNQLDRHIISLADRKALWPFDQLPILDSMEETTAKQTELDARIAVSEAVRNERKTWLNKLLDH